MMNSDDLDSSKSHQKSRVNAEQLCFSFRWACYPHVSLRNTPVRSASYQSTALNQPRSFPSTFIMHWTSDHSMMQSLR